MDTGLRRPLTERDKPPMLRQLDTHLWVTERPQKILGVQVETRMTVIKLADGTLFVHSPVRLDGVTRASLDQLGPVKHVVAPNRFHHLYVSDYPKNYPDAKIYAAPGLDTKRRDLHFDAILGDLPPPVWSGQIDQIVFRAFGALNETIFFDRRSRTALFTDLLFNINHSDSALTRFMARLDGGFGLAVPRTFRLPIRMRRRMALGALASILEWDFDRLTVAHGDVVERGAKTAMRNAWLFL
jgi:hypothetical protein